MIKLINNNLIWLDLEMTGLNPEKDYIIEIATLITNPNLEILAEGPIIAVHQPDYRLSLMDNWNTRVHNASGLINRVKNSKIDEKEAEIRTISFVSKWVSEGKSPICGNSINQDRRFLFHHMPILESYFHYRCLDVSSIRELVYRWKPEILDGLKKSNLHQASLDVKESVEELLYYKKYFFQL